MLRHPFQIAVKEQEKPGHVSNHSSLVWPFFPFLPTFAVERHIDQERTCLSRKSDPVPCPEIEKGRQSHGKVLLGSAVLHLPSPCNKSGPVVHGDKQNCEYLTSKSTGLATSKDGIHTAEWPWSQRCSSPPHGEWTCHGTPSSSPYHIKGEPLRAGVVPTRL